MMDTERLLLVSCRHCDLLITRVAFLGRQALDALLAHIRSCQPNAALPDPPGVRALLRHFDVRATEAPP